MRSNGVKVTGVKREAELRFVGGQASPRGGGGVDHGGGGEGHGGQQGQVDGRGRGDRRRHLLSADCRRRRGVRVRVGVGGLVLVARGDLGCVRNFLLQGNIEFSEAYRLTHWYRQNTHRGLESPRS